MSARFHLEFVRVDQAGGAGAVFAVWILVRDEGRSVFFWQQLGSLPVFDVECGFMRIRRIAGVEYGSTVTFTVGHDSLPLASTSKGEELWTHMMDRLDCSGGRLVRVPNTGRRSETIERLRQQLQEFKPDLARACTGVARPPRPAPVPAPGQGGRYYQVGVKVILNIHGTSAEDAQSHAADLLCRPSTTGRVLGAAHLEFEWCEELSDDELEEAALAQHLVTEGAAALQEESAS